MKIVRVEGEPRKAFVARCISRFRATENRIEDFRDGAKNLGVVRYPRGDFPRGIR
jgi:hypothetical protein